MKDESPLHVTWSTDTEEWIPELLKVCVGPESDTGQTTENEREEHGRLRAMSVV